MKTIAVIPAYNEATTIGGVLERTRPFVQGIVVVDDGSSDRTGRIARAAGAMVVTHAVNRGRGAAIGTGMAAALEAGAEAIVTLDADGQHDPSEIPMFLEELRAGADMVVGSRMLTRTGMPPLRQVAQVIGNAVTYLLFGVFVTDSQSGYRAFSRAAAERIEIRTNRMEVSSEIIAESRRNRLRLVEVPIKAIYTEYSLSKGQSFTVGLKTVAKLVLRRLS